MSRALGTAIRSALGEGDERGSVPRAGSISRAREVDGCTRGASSAIGRRERK